jgi:hypothetical protein
MILTSRLEYIYSIGITISDNLSSNSGSNIYVMCAKNIRKTKLLKWKKAKNFPEYVFSEKGAG